MHSRLGVITIQTGLAVCQLIIVLAAGAAWNPNSNGFGTSARMPLQPLSTNMSAAVQLPVSVPSVALGSEPFANAIFDGTVVWLIPRSASHLVYIDPSNGDAMTSVPVPPTTGDPLIKFVGGVYDGGDTIWLPPFVAGYFMTINVTSRTSSALSDASLDGDQRYAGAAFDGDSVWCAPYDSVFLLRIDRKMRRGIVVLTAPFLGNLSGGYFVGAVFDGTRVWFVPSRARNVLALDTTTLNVTSLSDWPSNTWRAGQENYYGGCFDGARVWLAPASAMAVAYVDVASRTISSLQLPSIGAMGSFAFFTAFFDGRRVWLMPYIADSFVVIDTPVGPSGAPQWQSLSAPANAMRRGGGASDGRSFYVVPFASTSPMVLRIPLGRTSSDSCSTTTSPSEWSTRSSSSSETQPRSPTTSVAPISATHSRTATLSVMIEGGRPHIEPTAAARAAQIMVTVSSLGVSPTTAASVGRLSALQRVLRCAASVNADDAWPITSHPTRISIEAAGAARAQSAGVVLGNVGLSMALMAFHGAVTTAVKLWRRDRTWGSAMALTRFPSLALPAQVALLTLVPQPGVSLATSSGVSSTGVGVAIGVVGLALCAFANFALWAGVRAATRLHVHAVPAVAGSAASTRWYASWLQVESEWELHDASWFGGSTVKYLQAYGSYFEDFTARGAWWAAFELAAANASGIAAGLTGSIGCAWASWLNVAPYVVYLVVVLWLRPHQRRVDFAAAVAGNGVMLTGAAFLALSACGAVGPQSAERVADFAAITSGILSVVTLLESPLVVLRRRVAQAARRSQEKASAPSEVARVSGSDESSPSTRVLTLEGPIAPPEVSALGQSDARASGVELVLLDPGGNRHETSALPLRRLPRRSAEGQALFDELEALLSPHAPSPSRVPMNDQAKALLVVEAATHEDDLSLL